MSLPSSSASWIAVQVAERLHEIAHVLWTVLPAVEGLAPTLCEQVTAGHHLDTRELRARCDDLAELSSQARTLAERLPEGDVVIALDELERSAALDLAEGIADPVRVRLAARVLPAGGGWRALARALQTTDTHASWEDLSVGDLLASFREARENDLQRLLRVAGVSGNATLASCDASEIQRLAAALAAESPA